MKLTCYTVDPDPSPLVPGRPERDWMDAFAERHPYRCLPLVVANTSGWELLSPVSFTASWNGGKLAKDIRIDADDDTTAEKLARHVVSHFSGGVITFHTGYLFRTEPGWDLWCGGPPNVIKDGVTPLTGVVETDWLPFPFTMNWRFTRPGMVSFKKGDPYCYVMPISHTAVDEVQPIVKRIEDDPALNKAYVDWGKSRMSFLDKLHAHDEETKRKGWQRHYFKGETPEGETLTDSHIHRRRLAAPRKAEKGE
jgi:hypothetical protein